MRCPKCQYISFGSAHRCRNCGYDFSLSEESAPLDLPIGAADEPLGPPADLPLKGPVPNTDAHSAAQMAAEASASRAPRPAARADLPLFTGSDDAPLVTPPAVPRAPLAVRRGPPVITRPRAQALEDEFAPDSDIEGDDSGSPRSARRVTPSVEERLSGWEDDPDLAAPPLPRALAGVLDLSIMGSIDLAVIYLTLRVSGLEFGDAMLLPKLPMLAFLLLLNGGYLVLFTAAGGQTIGKMAAGIRVVPDAEEGPARVPFGTAVLRAAAYLVSLLPAGLGLLPILFSPDRRALHDRLSATRVVKA